jgi:hypothetical protein
MYLPAEVVAFKLAWDVLDADGSGAVDADELLNTGGGVRGGGGEGEDLSAGSSGGVASAMSPAELRMTKSIFASADTDKSGELSMMELLAVQFPLADVRLKEAMLKFLAWREARARVREHQRLEREDELEDARQAAAARATVRVDVDGGEAAAATDRTDVSVEVDAELALGVTRLSPLALHIYELLKASQHRRRRALATMRTAGVARMGGEH